MSAANYDLFSDLKVEADKEEKQDTDVSLFVPLASRMRPKSLDDYIGQSHLIGPGRPLRMALERKQSYSMIFWGPPGVGKTTLALIIAKSSGAVLEQISAVTAKACEPYYLSMRFIVLINLSRTLFYPI